MNGTEDGKAEIRIKGTKDTMMLQDFCRGEEYRNYNLEFEDVSVHATEEASPFRYIYGEEKDDVLRAVLEGSYLYGFQEDDAIAGSKGDDVIYGNEGNDSISAGKGNDRIFGGSGDDVLDGGEGDDFLYGGKGEDCYLFGRNYGVDIISDHQGKNVVRLAEDISPDDLAVSRVGENAVISITNTEDRMIISGYTANEKEYILHFTDAEVFVRDCIAGSTDAFLSGTEREDYLVNDDKDIVAGDKGSDRILGTDRREYVFGDSGDDQLLTSAGNDIIFGGTGNDYVNGGDGDDWIDAGAGSDFVDGGKGDDQYLFRSGCGETAIMDSEGKNKILFGDGLQSDCIKAYRSNWNDLLITFDGWEDTLIIKNYCSDENSRNFTLVFADGTIVAATDKTSPIRTIYGTDDSEYMTSIYTDGVTKLGQEGDDQLVGSDGDDFLFGGGGNDRITGKTGDDVLDGGTGNDFLYGEEGDDTYLFRKGYGTDTIGDQEGVNQIEIYGFSRDQIKAYRTNWNNITITFEGSEDKLVIEGFFLSEASRNFYFTFNGGSKFHAAAINSPLRTIYGTDEDDYMTAMDDRGVTLLGENGKDNLNGGNGADKLHGGAGDDRLNGNDGNDILDGGRGDDILCGGAGKDTYLFEEGSGTDMIVDSEGINTISFGRGLKADGMTTCRTNWNDLTITFAGGDDQLVLCGFFTSDRYRQFDVCFADGTKFAYDDADNPIRIGQEE